MRPSVVLYGFFVVGLTLISLPHAQAFRGSIGGQYTKPFGSLSTAGQGAIFGIFGNLLFEPWKNIEVGGEATAGFAFGFDSPISSSSSFKVRGLYHFYEHKEYDFYAGLGIGTNSFSLDSFSDESVSALSFDPVVGALVQNYVVELAFLKTGNLSALNTSMNALVIRLGYTFGDARERGKHGSLGDQRDRIDEMNRKSVKESKSEKVEI